MSISPASSPASGDGSQPSFSAPGPQLPSQEASFPVTFPTGQPNKVHHSYIWLGPLTATLAVLFAAVVYNIGSIISLYRFLEEIQMANVLVIVGGVLAAFLLVYAIVTLVYVLAWRNMRYVFDESEFSLYSGVITKRQVHVPYARVQSVNHHASLIQRIFGVCTVSIDTAGGASNKAVRVPYVTLADAERIRTDLFVRKAAVAAGCTELLRVVDPQTQAQAIGAQQVGVFDTAAQRAAAPESPQQLADRRLQHQAQQAAPNALDDAVAQIGDWRGAFGGAVTGMEPVSFESGLDNGQLLLTGTTSMGTESSVVTLGITGVLLGVLANAAAMEPWMAGLGAAIAAGMLAIGLVAGLAGTVLSYGNFRVRRRGSRIEVERGLLQRVFTGIDIERVQSVVVKQSFIRRCLGYCEVSLGRINAGGSEGGAQANKQSLNPAGLVVHPFLKIDQVQPFLDQLLPEFAGMPVQGDLSPLPDVALRRGLLRQGIWRNPLLWTALAYAVFQALMHLFVVPASGANAADRIGLAIADQVGLVLYVVAALYTVAMLVNAVLWKKGSGHALDEGYLAVRNDGLHTDFTVLPRTKIQSGCTRTNPFQQAARVTTLVATTAAGSNRTNTVLWDVTAQQGSDWLDWLKPRRKS